MTEENVYQAPQSSVVEENNTETLLASRWARLGAAVLDSVILALAVTPVAFALGVFESVLANAEVGAEGLSAQYTVTMALLGACAFFLINGYLLATRGQTVGKKLVGIKMVDMSSRQLLPFTKLIGLRYLPVWVVAYLPMLGGILPLIDALFIFRGDKRCIHDLIAGTQVVNA